MYSVILFDYASGLFGAIHTGQDSEEAYDMMQEKFLKYRSIYVNSFFCIRDETTKKVTYFDSWTNPISEENFAKDINKRSNQIKSLLTQI